MLDKIDLYTILRSYANKSRNARVPLDAFIRFLQNMAGGDSPMGKRLTDWAIDTRQKVIDGLEKLIHQQKVEVRDDGNGQMVFLPYFYAEVIEAAYTNLDDSAEIPLPDEKMLRISVPSDQIRPIVAGAALISYLSNPQTSIIPIIKLNFPNSNGSALMLSNQLPEFILDIALKKLRDSFRRQGTLDFFTQRMLTRFRGQDAHVREFIATLVSHPNEFVSSISDGNDFSFQACMYLCQLIKSYVEEQVERSNDRKPVHITLGQSAELLLSISNYYKAAALDAKEKELAFDGARLMVLEPPWVYTIKDIFSYKTQKGRTLIDAYGEKEVGDFVKGLTSSKIDMQMPQILKFRSAGGEEWLVSKERVIPLCSKLMEEINSTILQEIKNRWTKKLRDYRSEAAMRYDDDFEEMISKQVSLFSPQLFLIARDKRTAIVQEETGPYGISEQVFNNYRPVPWRILFKFRRDTILTSCRFSLPIWYSFPVIVKIIAFFKYGPKILAEDAKTQVAASKKGNEDGSEKIKTEARKIMKDALPSGSSTDAYLESLNERWNQHLVKKDRDKIKRDVNALVKNYLNSTLAVLPRTTLTESIIDDMSTNIIGLNDTLKKINDKNSLRLYIKIYLLKMLASAKV
ncbi:MAG: hypothetical protein LBG72_01875 [Spirochaetaceae bacterium]|jgi:hypothetical protein|nr:hypothetical protein [Spirochaetaceae bacterium]